MLYKEKIKTLLILAQGVLEIITRDLFGNQTSFFQGDFFAQVWEALVWDGVDIKPHLGGHGANTSDWPSNEDQAPP